VDTDIESFLLSNSIVTFFINWFYLLHSVNAFDSMLRVETIVIVSRMWLDLIHANAKTSSDNLHRLRGMTHLGVAPAEIHMDDGVRGAIGSGASGVAVTTSSTAVCGLDVSHASSDVSCSAESIYRRGVTACWRPAPAWLTVRNRPGCYAMCGCASL